MVHDCHKKVILSHFAMLVAAAILLFFCGIKNTCAQQGFVPQTREALVEQWRWQPMELLTAKGVRSMTSDHEGNMWFGLDKGILKYDGYNWEIFDNGEFLQYPVGLLFLARDSMLYAASESGLLVHQNGSWKKVFPAIDSLNINVSCISQLPDGSLLAGVNNGLIHIDETQVTAYTVNARIQEFRQASPGIRIVVLPDEVLFQRNFGRVDDLFIEKDGLIWMFMSRNNDGRLITFNPADTLYGVLYNYHITDNLGGFKLSNRTQMRRTRDGRNWLVNGFYKSGIIRGKHNEWEQLKISDLFGGDELHTSILELSNGSLLIGGLGKLYMYNNDEWKILSAPALPIPSSRIILHESDDGWLWVAGIQGEVFRISCDNKKWTTYKGLNYHTTDLDGKEWYINVEGNVVCNDQGTWMAFDSSSGLIDSPVRLISTKAGTVWVAGSHNGIAATAYLENQKWYMQLHPDLSWGIDARSVFQSKDGSLWFGASVDRQDALGQRSGVLQLLNPDEKNLQWRHHTQQDGIVQHNVYGIGQSPDGAMWLGGTNLLRYDNDRWRPLPGNEFFNDFVDIVYSRSRLWVGSRYYGLFRFDGATWTHFTSNQGLPGNTIISIFEEHPESVWVITDKDIARFDGTTWHSGIFSSDFQVPREGGEIIVAGDGSVWLNKALREWKRRAFPFSITPSYALEDYQAIRYTREAFPPKTSIHLFTENVDPSGNTLIGWTGRDFWEETPSAKLTYSYRLNDGEWSEFTAETSVVFTNLKDGKYSFEVRARDLDFNIEPDPARIIFSVKPPIWKQAWFIALVVSFLLIIGFYEMRMIQRNRSLSRLNLSLREANQTLEVRKNEIEQQKEQILKQKEELEKKTEILEEKNNEIVLQRDQLSEMVEKVEELSRVKLRFFTNISHEFRTPLTLILGSIEQLLSSPDNNKSKLNRAYEIIQRNSRRILRLINQILEIRKIETGRLALNAGPGDLFDFISQIVNLFRDLANNQSVALRLHSTHQSLPALFDFDKMEKIIFNLLSNAFKSTPAGGTIEVSVSLKSPPAKPSGPELANENTPAQPDMIEVIVKDTGKGIPQQYLDKIFERFYQVDESYLHQKFDSSGIGLSYVKDLVEIHNGSIRVESEAGKGAAFILEIPYVPAESSSYIHESSGQDQPVLISTDIKQEIENMGKAILASRQPADKPPAEETEKDDRLLLLIVEDEPELRHFIRKILEKDFEIEEAENGVRGLEKALALQPDLIITDVMMPEMDGNELCHKLKTNLATNHIPLIMLTAQAAPENKMEGYQTGADAYLEKPFNTEFLKIRLNNLILAQQNTRDKIMRDLITQPSEIIVRSEDDKILRKIQEVLEENISNSSFDVESLSQQFFLSRFHFSRKIKQITGLSPKEIIDSFRLKRAGQLLQQQKLSVSEVAYMVGFEHPNSFSRAFRKYYNMTPTEFASQN